MLCLDKSLGRHSTRVAWLVYLACLRSHVLRAYYNFESKQAISITLFGRRSNNNNYSKIDMRGGWHKFLLEKVLITCSVVAIKTYQTWPAAKTTYTHGLFRKIAVLKTIIIQLLDEVEHDIMNYQKRGLCYLPKPKAEADNTDTRFW